MTKNLIERNRFASQLVEREIANITHRYGNIDHAGQHTWLPYHNASHARDVHDAAFATAQKLASTGQLDHNDIPLVRIAAVYHDHEQDHGSGPNESRSADNAIAAMAERPDLFDQSDQQKVRSMILGTTVSFPNGQLTQAAKAGDTLDAVVADADLGSLGHPTSMRQALHLLAEMEHKAGRLELPETAEDLRDIELPVEVVTSFLRGQHNLLANHHYLLPVNEFERGPQRHENLRLNDEALQAAQRGTGFDQLLDGAVAYARGLSQEVGFERGAA